MYLMNAPPVVATHTEWRTCGPPGGYSLPVCLNDSDSELSTRGTPISDKVQMIIESLRSTQSSVEMGDEMERKVLSGVEGHPQVCKVAVGTFVDTKAITKSPIINQQVNPLSAISDESHHSDSDDSVDRGIEEAILEYLKEKDGPKQKGETCLDTLQPSKPHISPVPGISKLNFDNTTILDNTILTPSSEFPKIVKIEKPITPALYPIKKYIKHKAAINESFSTTQQVTKNPVRLELDQSNSPSKSLSEVTDVNNKLDENTDSSSDDGIEEAIQMYQMEKKDQKIKRETLNVPPVLHEDSDSSSDDGIEEAIRCYQLEQLKEKSVVKPLLNKTKPKFASKPSTKMHTTTEPMKKDKLKKKKNKMKKQVLSVCMQSNTLLDSTKGKGHGLLSFKGQSSPTKANTTAELMCAEAILDISKTVMPGAFHQNLSLSSSSSVESCAQSSEKKLENESDDSSIDSEDGIEQEIRRFLEQKAQMLKKPLSSAETHEPGGKDEGENGKIKDEKKPGRLSLTKKRKRREGLGNVKDTIFKTLPDNGTESTPLMFSQESPTFVLQKSEQSEDKSSSLDSDEDLDTAIKDLLKTKKKIKIKKKTRDMGRKPPKGLQKEELEGCAPLSKKIKRECLSKHSSLKKSQKNQEDLKNISKLSNHIISQTKANLNKDINEPESKYLLVSTQTEPAFQIKEEDSSLDSDDSIELEIQKFLAEKAKVATAEQNKEMVLTTNGIAPMCTQINDEDVEQENQLAEIPRKSIPPTGLSTEIKLHGEKLPFLSPQCFTIRNSISTADLQSPAFTACSPSLLEPADGAGANRTDPRSTDAGNIKGASKSDDDGLMKALTPNMTPSQSASIKWRQSLGLPITDTKIRTPFRVTSSKINETTSGTRLYQSGVSFKVQSPVSVWPFARTSKSSFSSSTETAVNTGFQSHALSFSSSGRQHPGLSFTPRLAPGHTSQYPVEEETKSMVHISKDKSVYVELETNRTNHVQVRSRDRIEEKERQELLTANTRERNSGRMDEKEVHLQVKNESFIDEADQESVNEGNPEKKQGLSTL